LKIVGEVYDKEKRFESGSEEVKWIWKCLVSIEFTKEWLGYC